MGRLGRNRMSRPYLWLAAAVATAALSGCRSSQTLVINATEYQFAPARASAESGRVRIYLRNIGRSSHAMRIEGREGVVIVRPSERAVFLVDLAPGTYRFLCPLNGHDALGMVGTLQVGH